MGIEEKILLDGLRQSVYELSDRVNVLEAQVGELKARKAQKLADELPEATAERRRTLLKKYGLVVR